jgi:DNA-binding Xre family transcriptional regulator
MSKRGIITTALAGIPAENRQFVKKSLDIQDQVADLLAKKGWTQKELATRMGKTEAEVSRWLNELHNLTMKSIAKLEVALGEDIILTPGTAARWRPTVKWTVHGTVNDPHHAAKTGQGPAKTTPISKGNNVDPFALAS